jgi:RNA polymerase sigma-70 factor (ECF subfamily)
MAMSTTSISLLARLRQPGDDQAWQRFVSFYAPLLYHWAKKTGLPAGEIEDLVQDVFATLITRLPQFDYDGGQSFRGWLRTIIVNRCRDWFRRRENQPHGAPRETWDGSPDIAEWLAENEYRTQLASRALDLMRQEFEESTWRACFECVVNDRPAAEVARELGLTVNAVYVAKSRVLRRLRQELDGLWE